MKWGLKRTLHLSLLGVLNLANTLFLLPSCKFFNAKVRKSIAFILSNFKTPDKPILHIFSATILFSDSAIQLFV